MKPFALPLLALPMLSAVAAGASEAGLDAAAQNGARPRACASGGGLWVSPSITRSSGCTRLARGYSRLERDPAAARELGRELVRDARLRRAALFLVARASARMRDFEAARAAFVEAGVKGPQEISDVQLLHAHAQTAHALGRTREAAESYRLLMPRVDALPSRGGLRLAAVIEAAFAVMSDAAQGAGEAIAFLTPHLERGRFRGGEPVARLTLALALDRKGGAAVNAADDGEASLPARGVSWVEPLLQERELAALSAVSLASRDPESSRAAWRRYLELSGPNDPFRSHAEAKLRALGGAR